MVITQDTHDTEYPIRGYEPGRIRVNDQTYEHSLIVSQRQLITDWPPQSLTQFQPEHWHTVIALKPEIVLFGVGSAFKMPHPSLLAPLYEHRIAVESMDTGAACRTYMALLSEGRRVLAALLIR